jgi:hypothetical protein
MARRATFVKSIALVIMILIILVALAAAQAATGDTPAIRPAGETDVCPRPRVERLGARKIVLAGKGGAVRYQADEAVRTAAAFRTGAALLGRRCKALGSAGLQLDGAQPVLTAAKLSPDAFAKALAGLDVSARPDKRQLRQACILEVAEGAARLRAGGDVGLYYGLVTLCQLAETEDDGRIVVPEIRIADWPAVVLRLAKTSASANPPRKVGAFAAWLAPMKIGMLGLQYHGGNSKQPDENFLTNVRTHCRACRDGGVLETVAYFCPFRRKANAYDFTRPADRAAYAERLRWFMAQGAHGVEVDYNDWPGGREVPIADVLNLACGALKGKHPDAYVLYCPPLSGKQAYRGMATEEMAETLAKAPPRVWPLWTGMKTLIRRPLKAGHLQKWTRIAGRRPFLWVNRVSLGVPSHFARRVGEDFVFRGDFLPEELGRLVEGVHLNAGISKGYNKLTGAFDAASMAYLATAADYLWNPHDWAPAGTARRAKRFVEIMAPLIEPTAKDEK